MSIENFKGWRCRQLAHPSGDRIICFYFRPKECGDISLHDANHNVFRLNSSGEVVWQVRRDDGNRPADWWETLHRLAREQGLDGAREPFMYIDLQYPDGKRVSSDEHGDGTNIAIWQPGCTIWLVGSAYQKYILDPDTGVAKNVTPVHVHERPW